MVEKIVVKPTEKFLDTKNLKALLTQARADSKTGNLCMCNTMPCNACMCNAYKPTDEKPKYE